MSRFDNGRTTMFSKTVIPGDAEGDGRQSIPFLEKKPSREFLSFSMLVYYEYYA